MSIDSVKAFIREVEKTEDTYYCKKKFLHYLNKFDRMIGMTEEKKEVIVTLKKIIYKRNIGESFGRDDTPMAILIMGQQGIGKTEFAKIFSELIMCVNSPRRITNKITKVKDNSMFVKPTNYNTGLFLIVSGITILALFSIKSVRKTFNKTINVFLDLLCGLLLVNLLVCALGTFLNVDRLLNYLVDLCKPEQVKLLEELTKDVETYTEPYVILRKADLVAYHIGKTSHMTRKVLNAHKGKCIIIDEFYDILREGESDRSFGPECITAIMEFMDNNPNNPIFFLGYEEDLNSGILKSQKGFSRRCGVKIVLKKYSAEELYSMFITKIEDNGLEIKKENKKDILEMFKKNATSLVNYGGDIKLLVGKVTDTIAEKYYNNTKKHTEVTVNFVKQAFSKLIKENANVGKTNLIGNLINVS